MNFNVEKQSAQVVCDVPGCQKVAEYFIKRKDAPTMADTLKLCPDCCKALLKLLQNIYKKESVKSEDN